MASGQEQVRLIFARLKANMQDAMVSLPKIIGEEVIDYTLEAFNKESWNGKAWPKRANKKNTKKILVKTGFLKGSFDSGAILKLTSNSVTIGTYVKYAAIHNNGGVITRQPHSDTFIRPRIQRGERKGQFRAMTKLERDAAPQKGGFTYKAYQITMPQRRFLGVTPELIRRVKKVANAHIKTFIKR